MSNLLEMFKKKLLDPQKEKIAKAQAIMDDVNYKWDTPEKKTAGGNQLKIYKDWLAFYQEFYDEGCNLCLQHETLTNHLCKHYETWYNDVSNEGKQEPEIMEAQADILSGIFSEIYQELKPLNLNLPTPKALNMK